MKRERYDTGRIFFVTKNYLNQYSKENLNNLYKKLFNSINKTYTWQIVLFNRQIRWLFEKYLPADIFKRFFNPLDFYSEEYEFNIKNLKYILNCFTRLSNKEDFFEEVYDHIDNEAVIYTINSNYDKYLVRDEQFINQEKEIIRNIIEDHEKKEKEIKEHVEEIDKIIKENRKIGF